MKKINTVLVVIVLTTLLIACRQGKKQSQQADLKMIVSGEKRSIPSI